MRNSSEPDACKTFQRFIGQPAKLAAQNSGPRFVSTNRSLDGAGESGSPPAGLGCFSCAPASHPPHLLHAANPAGGRPSGSCKIQKRQLNPLISVAVVVARAGRDERQCPRKRSLKVQRHQLANHSSASSWNSFYVCPVLCLVCCRPSASEPPVARLSRSIICLCYASEQANERKRTNAIGALSLLSPLTWLIVERFGHLGGLVRAAIKMRPASASSPTATIRMMPSRVKGLRHDS